MRTSRTRWDVTRALDTNGGYAASQGGNVALQQQPVCFSCKDHGADAGEIAPTLRAMPHDGSHANAGGQVAVGFYPTNRQPEFGNYEDVSPAVKVGSGGASGNPPAVAFEPRFVRNGRGAPDEVTSPLKAESGRTGKGDGATCVATAMAVRRLTPVECERLQGFPDNWTQIPYRGKPAADGPRYKALGNSMAVPCMRWIGDRLDAVERILREAKCD
jgi:DNA (cytosine-5)-methyltransferase 1